MSDDSYTLSALSDIEALKKAVLSVKNKTALGVESVDTHLIINAVAMLCAGVLCLYDALFLGITHDVLMSENWPQLKYWGIIDVGIVLLGLLIGAYGLIFFKSRKQNVEFDSYIARYFFYFQNFAVLSDIFVKFCVFSLVLLADRPDWVAPLLILFTGDLVFQGRFFCLSPIISVALGLTCFGIAAIFFLLNVAYMVWPLAIFSAIALLSTINIVMFRQKLTAQATAPITAGDA